MFSLVAYLFDILSFHYQVKFLAIVAVLDTSPTCKPWWNICIRTTTFTEEIVFQLS